MNYWEAVVLGIIQGFSEYLPVSSSGHLVLAQKILGVNAEGVTFEVVVHIGSLFAVIMYFRHKLWEMAKSFFAIGDSEPRRYAIYLILGTFPAALAGLILEDFFDRMFDSPQFTSFFLLITGVILISTKFAGHGARTVSLASALLIGLAQACAILPGISRSGSTISAGIWSRLEPAKAAEFSFLLSIPAIAGAAVLKSNEIASLNSLLIGPYSLAALTSFVSSLVAIHWLLSIIKKGRFGLFAFYCFAVGALSLYLFSK